MFCSPQEVPIETYWTPYFTERLDLFEFPARWANGETAPNMVHLLSYPFLFSPRMLINYFRAINHRAMHKACTAAFVNGEVRKRMKIPHGNERGREARQVSLKLYPSMTQYLILNIRRDHIMEDATDEIWRREPHELMKPLKVRMGLNEGEEGVDLGGVSQEFFRLAMAEAMDPKYGETLPTKSQ